MCQTNVLIRSGYVGPERKEVTEGIEAAKKASRAGVEYDQPLEKAFGDLMTVEVFRGSVVCGAFVDYDGYGNPVKSGMVARGTVIQPSKVDEIPADASHILWYNR